MSDKQRIAKVNARISMGVMSDGRRSFSDGWEAGVAWAQEEIPAGLEGEAIRGHVSTIIDLLVLVRNHDPEACLLGNMRAREMDAAIVALLEERSKLTPDHVEDMVLIRDLKKLAKDWADVAENAEKTIAELKDELSKERARGDSLRSALRPRVEANGTCGICYSQWTFEGPHHKANCLLSTPQKKSTPKCRGEEDGRDMISKESNHFKWLKGMSNTFGGVIVWVSDSEDDDEQMVRWCGRHGMTDLETLDDEEPDLTDEATQGAIMFRIFETLGIEHYRVDGGRFKVRHRFEPFGPLSAALSRILVDDLPALIRAVFAALNSEADA